MNLDRNICSKCGEKNFSDSEYNTPLSLCNNCFLKHYEEMQRRVADIEKGKVWIDEETELIWELKQKNNIDETYTSDEALKFAEQLNKEKYAGYDDWRVPTVKELQSLVDFTRYDPAIKEPLAKNIAVPYCYWSSSPSISNHLNAWLVSFYRGDTYNRNWSSKFYVLCVRGRQ
jgi:transcription elongation factor Elf1